MDPKNAENTPEPRPRRRGIGRVPVSSRDNAPAKEKKARKARPKWTPWEMSLVAGTVIIVLAAVAAPLSNYHQGRTEIARVTQAIEDKTAEKEELLAELDKYNSTAYLREQARNRLGVIEEGETAFRIMDPAMDNAPEISSPDDERFESTWYEKLLASIADVPDAREVKPEDMHMPVEQPAEVPGDGPDAPAPEDEVPAEEPVAP